MAYIFQGYWEEHWNDPLVFRANLILSDALPQFNFFDTASPIYTHARFLPGSKVNVRPSSRRSSRTDALSMTRTSSVRYRNSHLHQKRNDDS
jgi:ADP-glucose pyrophosphorylase